MEDIHDKINEITDTADYTASIDPEDIRQNRLMAALSYLSWLVLIPLFVAGNSPFTRFHVNQGIILAIIETVLAVLLGILSNFPLIGWIFAVIKGLAGLICFALLCIGIVNTLNGKARELPLIGSIRLIR